ncbi:MAG: prohibitin family protein [Saprospiraceae bacterium]|nr:prohibitin family protein [Saprospiraceae bacterium]
MKSSFFKSIALLSTCLIFMASCTVVRQGEVGITRTFGKYSDKIYTSGLRGYNPLTSTIIKVPAQTRNLEVQLDIPSKEGLTIRSEVSILYNIEPKKVPDILRNLGVDYESSVILPVFRSAVADISSKYFAKDMHSGNRSEIEKAIRELMMQTMTGKGVFVESVLLKSIQLPRTLSKAIEEKLESEQQAQRMEFVLQAAKREAERKIIEAEGVRDANKIISQGLTDKILQFKNIEAWLKLSESSNSKVIITNGNMPMMLNPTEGVNTGTTPKVGTTSAMNTSLMKE